jgi:cellulose synthase/poly-beta-1,6-N-acetylglucosamine synthase-like glycosyltransferase
MTTLALMQGTATVIAAVVIGTGLLQNALQVLQLGIAAVVLRRRPPADRLGLLWQRYADVVPPIALLVPAYNEELSIVESVRSLLGLQYPNFEIVVVNDGSKDGTLQALIDGFRLVPAQRVFENSVPHKPIRTIYRSPNEPRLVVADKENGGKADALNAAVNLARSPIVCSMDADSLLEQDSLLRAVQPFVDDPQRTVAVGATIRVGNGCRIAHGHVVEVGLPRSVLAVLQTIEYLRAFLMARLAWSELGSLTIVSGAFGLFRRRIIIDVGGFSRDTVGEDLELIIKIHRHLRDRKLDYRVNFVPEPVCWTQVPESLAVLGRQRARWQRGALETFFKHSDMLLRPRYGRIGSIAFLNMLLVDVLGPIAEMLGYVLVPLFWATGLLSFDYFLAYLAVTFAFGIAISTGSLVLEELELRRFPRARELSVLLGAAILENFGYRQINNYWRVKGLWQYLRGRQDWGQMTRLGFRKA